MNSKITAYQILLVLVLVFFSCQDAGIEREQFHPVFERLPYIKYDVEELIIKREFDESIGEETIIFEKSLLERTAFLKQFKIELSDSLDLPLVNLEFAQFASINSERYLLLDKELNELYEYKISNKKWNRISSSGRGPGEIMFSSDMSIIDNMAYITTKDARISIFDCSLDTCKYIKTIITENIQPVSTTMLSNNELLIMGNPASISNYSDKISKEELSSLFRITDKGIVKHSLGDFYNIENQWMLIRPFSDGKVRSNSNFRNEFIQFFSPFPYLYYFKDYQLAKKIIFSGFNLSEQKYIPATQELFVNFEDYSLIEEIQKIKDSSWLIKIKHLSNRQVISNGAVWDELNDFYFVDLETDRSFFLGSIFSNAEELWFTKDGIIRLRNNRFYLYKYELING